VNIEQNRSVQKTHSQEFSRRLVAPQTSDDVRTTIFLYPYEELWVVDFRLAS